MTGDAAGEPWAATGDQDMTFTVQGPIGDKIRYFGAFRTTSTETTRIKVDGLPLSQSRAEIQLRIKLVD